MSAFLESANSGTTGILSAKLQISAQKKPRRPRWTDGVYLRFGSTPMRSYLLAVATRCGIMAGRNPFTSLRLLGPP
jgi:hypothetical protein